MLHKLISECTDYDFKRELEEKKPKSWLKSVSAFANTIGGTLFFGVDNDKKPYPIENLQYVSDKISELINARIKPTPLYVLTPFNEDGNTIIAVKIYSGTATPYYYEADGIREAYVRSGNESIVAPRHILNELVLKGTNQTYDTLATGYRKSDYSFTFLEATFYEKTNTRMTEADYRSFGLVREDGLLTNAGVLFADQAVYRHNRLFCTRWNGLTKTSILGEASDDKEIEGGILQQLYSAMDFVRNNTKKKWRKSGMVRIENPEYDEEAVREAIVNAIIHREYTRLGAEVTVNIYDNRMEIVSPGSMFSGKKIAKEVTEVVASERRNPILADLFARMNFMERRGSGLKKMTDRTNKLFNDGKNHVEFSSDDGFFRVTIYNANYGVEAEGDNLQEQNAPVNTPVNAPVKLNKTKQAIYEKIVSNTSITIDELTETLGKDRRTITRNIKSLKEKGLIERVGSDKTGYWKVL